MIIYIAKRLAALVPVFFGITIISFFVIRLAPGKATDVAGFNPKISYETRARLEALEGYDLPVYVQYGKWLKKFVTFDFGKSRTDGRPVSKKILERLPVTILINSISVFLIFLIGIPLGILSAVKRNSIADRFTTVLTYIGFSTPEFWLALLAMSFFGITLGWLPISGIKSIDFEYYKFTGKVLDVARHLILPASIAVFGSLAGISRYMRSSMVGILREDYIRTARAKGLTEASVIFVHALKNALLPVITIIGLSVPGLIGGSVIFESIFAIPGMGRLYYDSVMARDDVTIMGILAIGAVLTLLGNLLADIAYAYADPRINRAYDKKND